jgi:predicted negative regulator of RcsB-dependent stress response
MAAYDLQEQEQIDDLKAWWKRWGNAVTLAVALAALAFAGVQGWRWWNAKQAEEASVVYGALAQAVRNNELPKAKEAGAQLADKFARTGYAPRGALMLAKALFDSGDVAGARAQVQWVIDRSDEAGLKEVARYRLAEILLNDKKYEEALKVLDAKHADSFAGLYADLRGDALAAAGRNEEAKSAYQAALAKLDAKSQYRNYVQVKLEALGGTAEPPKLEPGKTSGSGAAAPAKK